MKPPPETSPRSKLTWLLLGLVLIALIGALDHYTGYELSFSLFYLAAIALTSWRAGRTLGLVTAVLSAAVWLGVDLTSGHTYSHPAIAYWNAAVRLGFFVIVATLLAALQRALRREVEMARVDPTTGAVNGRHFRERVDLEIERAKRYSRPFTIAYLDLDNFKEVNDRFGHAVGDEVLRTVAETLRQRLRKTDVVARLGGDEFAVFLPEADQAAARGVIEAVRAELGDRMQTNTWPVTLSVGVLTASTYTDGLEGLLHQADELMYRVKRSTKNAVLYETASAQDPPPG